MQNVKHYVIAENYAILTATFTAAVTNIITSNAHGLSNGDMVVFTTSDTLPAGLSTGTVYWVRDVTTNTFKVASTSSVDGGGPVVDITDTGTGTHTFTVHDIGRSIYVGDVDSIVISLNSASNANIDTLFMGSAQEDCPDFSAAKSSTNQIDTIEVVDQEDGTAIDGDTGISLTGTDDNRIFEMNASKLNWINCLFSGWSAGTITIKVACYSNI